MWGWHKRKLIPYLRLEPEKWHPIHENNGNKRKKKNSKNLTTTQTFKPFLLLNGIFQVLQMICFSSIWALSHLIFADIITVHYLKLSIHENHIWLGSEELYEWRSLQLYTQLLRLRKESLKKKSGLYGIRTLDLCDTDAPMIFIHIILHSAVQIYDFHIFIISSSSFHGFITNQFNDLLKVGLLS